MFLRLIDIVDNSPYSSSGPAWLFKSHDGVTLGKIIDDVTKALKDVPWLSVRDDLHEVRITDPTSLDDKFSALTKHWRSSGRFACLAGWRNERYNCYTKEGRIYFSIERSAAALFGIVTYGCHITGYCPTTKEIWIPRRALTKPTYPGMLDNTVAGGLGDNLGFRQCALKECEEEAGLQPEYVEPRLVPCGVVTYEFIDPVTKYYQPEVECVYDIPMKAPSEGGLTPEPQDGEAEDFQLMSYHEVKGRMLSGEFKYNCALVLVDFFIRHGEITVETEPDYFDIVCRCHRRLEYPLRKSFG